MCFKSDETLGDLHFSLEKRARPSASAFSPANNVELFGLEPMHSQGVPKYITRESGGGGGSIIATFLLPPRYIHEELNNVGTIFDQRRRR